MRKQRRRTLASLMALTGLFALALTGTTSTVSAAEPSWGDLDPTFDLLAQQPGFQVGGLGPTGRAIVVYWSGDFGPDARAIVADSHRHGVPVSVLHVPYGYDALREIVGPLGAALAAKGIALDGYRIGDPFDEIAVWGRALDTSADARRVAEDTAADLLPSDLRLTIITSPEASVLMAAGSATLDRADGHRVAFPGRWRLAR